MKLICSKFQSQIEIPAVSDPQVINRPGLSLIIIEHPQTGYCATCDMRVAAYVMGAQVSIVGAHVPPGPSPILIAKEMPLVHG